MLTYIVTLHSGHRYTIRAEQMRAHPAHGFVEFFVEFLAAPSADGAGQAPEKRVVAAFGWNAVLSVVSREHLVAVEEPGEGIRPHVAAPLDAIPF